MTNALIAIAIGLAVWIALLACVLALFRFSRSSRADDQALDDMEQAAAVSKPADLHPHVRAGTAYGEPLQ